MEDIKNNKVIIHTENKLQNGKSKAFLINNLNVSELNSPMKGKDWRNLFFEKLTMVQLYAVYKRFTLDPKT